MAALDRRSTMMRHLRGSILMLGLGVTLLWPRVAVAAPADQSADHLELVALTTRGQEVSNPVETIPFRAVVNYQLHTASNGFLLLFLFENTATSSTRQSSEQLTVQSGEAQVTMSIDYALKPEVRTLTLMVALFKTEQKLLTWVSTTPIDLAPWPGRAAFDKAMAARLATDYAGADTYLSTAIQASPNTGNYYYWRGDTRIYLSQYDAAIQDFSRSIMLMPEDRASRVGRGISLLWKGDAESALADLTFAIDHSSSPDRLTAFAYRARGTANASLGRPAQAITDYQAYLALTPGAADQAEVEGWIADLS
jgi:tetratricopeptide (TPR) repeat protein